jgi:hypothetical protein
MKLNEMFSFFPINFSFFILKCSFSDTIFYLGNLNLDTNFVSTWILNYGIQNRILKKYSQLNQFFSIDYFFGQSLSFFKEYFKRNYFCMSNLGFIKLISNSI